MGEPSERITDLDAIETLINGGLMYVVDPTNTTQDLAGSAFIITKENFLKETKALVDANTAKVGISSGQASAIEANTAKVGITTEQSSAIQTNTNNTSKVLPSNVAASISNVGLLRYVEQQYRTALEMVMQTALGVYAYVTVKENIFDIAKSIAERFRLRAVADGATFESLAALETTLTNLNNIA